MNVSEQLDKINQQLMSKNYKLTMQREAIVRVLLENETGQMRAEEVFMRIKAKHIEIGLATVYRTLELLAELHIVEKMNFDDGAACFDLHLGDRGHRHHHLICTVCGKMEEMKEDWLLELEQRLKREYGFSVKDHHLDFTGIYQTCQGKNCKRTNRAVS